MERSLGRRVTLGIAALFVIAGITVAWFVSGISPADLVVRLRSMSGQWWAIPAFIALYVAFDLLFIPPLPLSVAAVVMWGWVRGGLIELFAATFGALFPYLLARSTLGEWARAKLTERSARVAAVLEREGVTLLLLLRFVPIIPYTPLNYVAGLSSVRPVPYLLATLVGVAPATFVFAYFVEALADGVVEPASVGLRVIGAGVVLAVLLIAMRLAAAPLRRRLAAAGEGRTASPPGGADRD